MYYAKHLKHHFDCAVKNSRENIYWSLLLRPIKIMNLFKCMSFFIFLKIRFNTPLYNITIFQV